MAVTDEAILKIKEMILSGETRPRGSTAPGEGAVRATRALPQFDARGGQGARGDPRSRRAPRGRHLCHEPRTATPARGDVVRRRPARRLVDPRAVRGASNPRTGRGRARRRAITPEVIADLRDPRSTPSTPPRMSRAWSSTTSTSTVRSSPRAGNAYLAEPDRLDVEPHDARAECGADSPRRTLSERTLAEHRAIVDALGRGDAELAQALAIVHIAGVEQWLRDANAA